MRPTAGVFVTAILAFASTSWAGQQPLTPLSQKGAPAPRDFDRAARELAEAMARQFAFDQKPSVNCGLTLVPPDPRPDAKFRVSPPKGPTPTIRTSSRQRVAPTR